MYGVTRREACRWGMELLEAFGLLEKRTSLQ